MSTMIVPRSSVEISLVGRWSRLPGLRIAAALLLASSGCATHVPHAPEVPPAFSEFPPPTGQALLQMASPSRCPTRIVIRATDGGQPLLRIESGEEPVQLIPPKTLQSSYEDYLAKRGLDRIRDSSDEAPSTTTAPPKAAAATPPPVNRVAYSIPSGHRRLQVADGSRYGFPGPFPIGGGGSRHDEVFLIVAAVGLVFAIADAFTRKDPVVLEVEVEAGKQYLLHCDAKKDPWAWVTLHDDASPEVSRDQT